jgi:sulfide:quinone oxidoreductase
MGGFGGMTRMIDALMKRHHVDVVTNAAVREVTHDKVYLEGGGHKDFKLAMLAPRFVGVEPVRALSEITSDLGFVRVNEHYQTEAFPEVYAAGVAVDIAPPEVTAVPCGVPKTGYLSEEMGRVVAHNIAATIAGEPQLALPPGAISAKLVLDAGNTGIIMTSDRHLEPREHAWLIPGPEAHWAKLAFERYFLATRGRGQV